MKRAIIIEEKDLSNVSGGTFVSKQGSINIEEGCETWKCNVCSSGLKWNYLSGQTAPVCKHYAFTSCRNCQYFNAQNNSCGKKI